jgi:hypothetical protein
MLRITSTSCFVLVLVAFALPFATVVPSCSSERVTVTGYDLATGDSHADAVSEGFPLATAALAFAVVGAVIAAVGRHGVAQLVVATLGVQSLHLEFYAIALDADDVDIEVGWVAAALAFAAAGAAAIVALRRPQWAFAASVTTPPEHAFR